MREEHSLVDRHNKVTPINGTFVTEGTHPPGSEWARIPIPSVALGACCIAGPHDTATTPHRCLPGEGTYCKPGAPCKPCPQTPGSDCSRCDNHAPKDTGEPAFPPLLPGAVGCDHFHAVRDVLKVPAHLAAGRYVLGWRYDCEATAQGQCARSLLRPYAAAMIGRTCTAIATAGWLTAPLLAARCSVEQLRGHHACPNGASDTGAHAHWRSILP
eukprot:COSAG01_NODE_16160_length_1264_cov_1.037768_3_plen_213_part_01